MFAHAFITCSCSLLTQTQDAVAMFLISSLPPMFGHSVCSATSTGLPTHSPCSSPAVVFQESPKLTMRMCRILVSVLHLLASVAQNCRNGNLKSSLINVSSELRILVPSIIVEEIILHSPLSSPNRFLHPVRLNMQHRFRPSYWQLFHFLPRQLRKLRVQVLIPQHTKLTSTNKVGKSPGRRGEGEGRARTLCASTSRSFVMRCIPHSVPTLHTHPTTHVHQICPAAIRPRPCCNVNCEDGISNTKALLFHFWHLQTHTRVPFHFIPAIW